MNDKKRVVVLGACMPFGVGRGLIESLKNSVEIVQLPDSTLTFQDIKDSRKDIRDPRKNFKTVNKPVRRINRGRR